MLTVADLNHRKIVLCGREKAVKWFYKEYPQVNVVGVVVIEKGDVEYFPEFSDYGATLRDIPTRLVKDEDCLMAKDDSMLFVICQKHSHHNNIANMLECYGKRLGIDYVYSWEIEMALSSKKIVALGGYYCYIYDLIKLFQEHPYTKDNFLFYPFIWHDNINLHHDASIKRFLKSVDYYIFNLDSNIDCRFDKDELSPNCKLISFPCVNFRAFFPQTITQSGSAINPYYVKFSTSASCGYKYRDCWLERLFEMGKGIEEIVNEVSDINYIDHRNIVNSFEKELRVVHYYERNCDVKFADYIRCNYQEFRLLNTSGHWSIQMLYECFRQICLLMSVDGIDKDQYKEKMLLQGRKYTQIPIYPCVAAALGIKWYKSDSFNNIRLNDGWIKQNFREYAQTYLKYLQNAKRIRYFSTVRKRVIPPFIVAIDGFSCTGKSFVSKTVAQKYGMNYLNTGNLYRAATAYSLKEKTTDGLVEVISNCKIEANGDIIVGEYCFSDKMLDSPIIDDKVSQIAQISEIRQAITSVIRSYCKSKAVFVDGRDIGTVVFPEADLKFFFTASMDARSKAWLSESTDQDSVIRKIETMQRKDYQDVTRTISPLKQAEDAFLINRDSVTIDEAIIVISLQIDKKFNSEGEIL